MEQLKFKYSICETLVKENAYKKGTKLRCNSISMLVLYFN